LTPLLPLIPSPLWLRVTWWILWSARRKITALPWLAERWEIKNNNREYTFHLRKDVTFSDGTKLDAAAVKYNFERILDPKTTSSYSKSLLGPIDAITTR
jgi:ABC-type transport system substrate-binding protein